MIQLIIISRLLLLRLYTLFKYATIRQSFHPSILSDKFCKFCYQILAYGPKTG